ncbi:GerAB/ArcD/ProY family transporter [Halalkalibacter nanhaiisediminis]|uniref:Spore germination protein (Amino acid permease) n=1 Tax=Halalkalibacter nanhaiisediminis TaxID=688079 RepID=A0A562QQJ1_9BACI|nr:GerAB/ArcD/ProY family transporter [Halalkalibacter nanhaiisediminis]TWI59018.1 spore germination protein (amino acid permease) [Halalkalibacter nanhaiisediminis]
MKKHHIGIHEVASVGIIFIITKIFLPLPRAMVEIGGTAAWMIILIAALFCPLCWWGIKGVMTNAKPGSSLITATEEIMGPYLGSLINLSYFSFFFMVAFMILREFSEVLATDIIPRTPLSFILLSLLIPASVVAHSGIEVLGRISWITIGLVVSSLAILLFGGVLTHSEPNALVPFWGTGKSQVISSGVVKSSLFSEFLVFGFLIPRMRKQEEWAKAAWWCITISFLILLCTIIAYLFIFPYPTAIRVNFPLLEISRIIIFGRWIQRVESIFLIVWLICTVIKLSIAVYCSTVTLSQMLKLPTHQPLIFPLMICIYSFAILPTSEMSAVNWDQDFLRVYGSIFSICLPLLTWGVGILRKKRRTT